MRKNLKIAAMAFLVGAILFAVVVSYQTFQTRLKAEQLLAQLSEITIGSEQHRVQEVFGRFPEWTRTQECSDDSCQYIFTFQNTWLNRIHFSSWLAFFGSIHVQNGIVSYKEMYLGDGRSFWIRIMDLDCYPCPAAKERFWVLFHSLNPRIYLTPASTQEQRAMAYNLNVGVLSKIGSINHPRELLPAWDYLHTRALENPR